MSQEALDAKSRKWNSLQGRRYNSKLRSTRVEAKAALPAEALRRVMKDHGDMSYVAPSSLTDRRKRPRVGRRLVCGRDEI